MAWFSRQIDVYENNNIFYSVLLMPPCLPPLLDKESGRFG